MPTFEIKGSYVIISPAEGYSLDGYKKAIREVAALCKQHGIRKILADIRGIDVRIPVVERFQLGVEMARILGSGIQLAILAPSPEYIDRMGENAAVNRGGRVFVTHSMDEALRWLEVPEEK
jgi:hypothetical protein